MPISYCRKKKGTYTIKNWNDNGPLLVFQVEGCKLLRVLGKKWKSLFFEE